MQDLFRPSNAPKNRVNVPKEIINFLRENQEQRFYFPWSMDGTFVYNNFWQGLLGISRERRGWLSDTVCKTKLLLISITNVFLECILLNA